MKKTTKIQQLKQSLIEEMELNSQRPKKPLNEQQIAFKQVSQAATQVYKGLELLCRHLPKPPIRPALMGSFFDVLKVIEGKSIAYILETDAGKAVFKNFDCNEQAKLATILSAPFTLDHKTNSLNMPNFEPKKHVLLPGSATQMCLQFAVLSVDFDRPNRYSLGRSKALYVPVNAPQQAVSLKLETFPMGLGIKFCCLQLLFFKDIAEGGGNLGENGLYSLKKTFNVLSVVGMR